MIITQGFRLSGGPIFRFLPRNKIALWQNQQITKQNTPNKLVVFHNISGLINYCKQNIEQPRNGTGSLSEEDYSQ